MIIVKTKNGDRFINDKAVAMVEHVRDKAVVNAYGDKGVFFHIKTVGDLLRIGSRDFKKYRTVGGGSIRRIDDALETLYDIKSW